MMRRLPLVLCPLLACTEPSQADTEDSGTTETVGTAATADTTSSAETAEAGNTTDTTGTTDPPIPEDATWLDVTLDAPIAEVDERYLSYALDTDKVIYQQFDFDRPRLLNLTAALSPALLRIGGTKADSVYNDLSDMPISEAPAPYTRVLDRAIWDAACEFALALDVEIAYTVNAGLGPRDLNGLWTDDQARELIEYTVAASCPVSVWELGNEIGGFPLEFGFTLTAEEYAADFVVFDALVDEVDPQAKTAGPASAYWPIEGEVLTSIIPGLLANAGELVDIITWHYYPQQSSSCPVGTRRVDKAIIPQAWLETIDDWAAQIEAMRDADAPAAAIWLGESGHAQCGGEPGISDTFASSFWWLDQLGRIAVRGQPIVVRQALSGGAYKLIEDSDLSPTPDYYASVLWKRHMGARVLATQTVGGSSKIHAYAHCDVSTAGGVAMVLINYDEVDEHAVVVLDPATVFEASVVTAQEVTATTIEVNGIEWTANEDGTVPEPIAEAGVGLLTLPPASYAFVRIPDAGAAACE